MTTDHRKAAQEQVTELIRLLRDSGPAAVAIVAECEALERAIGAFHMEGIRFRMYNVDRLVRAAAGASAPDGRPAVPAATSRVLEDLRKHLEAAGFHTRSHQAPV
jgi:hypothetical protein